MSTDDFTERTVDHVIQPPALSPDRLRDFRAFCELVSPPGSDLDRFQLAPWQERQLRQFYGRLEPRRKKPQTLYGIRVVPSAAISPGEFRLLAGLPDLEPLETPVPLAAQRSGRFLAVSFPLPPFPDQEAPHGA